MLTNNTLADWLRTTHGQYLMEREMTFVDRNVEDVFGFNALQLGMPQYDLLRASRIPLKVLAGSGPGVHVRASMDELPFDTNSMDLVVLPHVLEFSDNPHEILREVERVLMAGGYVVLTGFNPRSLWGLRRVLGSKQEYPWCGKFIALSRLKDWLALLGFEIVAGRFSCYAPPFGSPAWLKRLHFMEPAGDRWWAVCGGVYFLQAIKRVPGMRVIRPEWNGRLLEKLVPVRPKLNSKVTHKELDSK
jgi:SAM-dependent methyltransferase